MGGGATAEPQGNERRADVVILTAIKPAVGFEDVLETKIAP
jgi:hypothetical protein